MRPVDKGAAPRAYAKYQDAGPDLQARLGGYCSYCERQIETNLAVEHIQPKSTNPTLATEWDNFLLGCVNCNSSKGKTVVVLADYLWPDADNTLRALEYTSGGLVQPNPSISPQLQAKAEATIKLVGLDKVPGHIDPDRRPTPADSRWKRRREAWQKASRYLSTLANPLNNTPHFRNTVAELAAERGMFSIWWTVFSNDKDMRRRLRLAFPGTAATCFDAAEQPLPRGQV